MDNLAPIACLKPHNQIPFTSQRISFTKLKKRVVGLTLTPLEAAHYLAPDLVDYVYLEQLPAEGGFGCETRISLNVAETGVDHAQVEAQGFYHNGIHFRTAELKAALELAYPERFI